MTEYLTPTNVAIIVSLLTSAYAVLRTIAPKTKNTVDDSIVAFVEKNRAWVRDFAWPVWSLVEELQRQGKILKGSKYGEYIAIFRDYFKKTHGREMPPELEADAELLAKGLSAADKIDKGLRVTPINPTLGQVEAK